MLLKTVFRWIYCLDFYKALLLLAMFTGVFCVLRAKFSQYRFWKPTVLAALIIWVAVAVTQTIFWRTPDTTLEPIWQPFQSYIDALKEGGQKELLRSNFMNAVFFYPAGLLTASVLSARWKATAKLQIVLAVAVTFSAAIEFVQYRYGLGLAQIDDVIHNAMGAMVGALVILIIPTAAFNPKQGTNLQK